MFALSVQAGDVPVNGLRELDFLGWDDIFKIRLEAVKKHPALGANYTTDGPVLNQIVGGKEWPGIEGLNCRGDGPQMTYGLSRESIYIDNPFLLIGLDTGGFKIDNWECPNTYPVPTRIFISETAPRIYVEYDVTSYYKVYVRRFMEPGLSFDTFKFSFSGRNARDFGYSFVYAEAFKNVVFPKEINISKFVIEFRDFIHLAYNLGCACNNGSPYQPELDTSFTQLPAMIRFKLWKKRPASAADPADMIYEMKIY